MCQRAAQRFLGFVGFVGESVVVVVDVVDAVDVEGGLDGAIELGFLKLYVGPVVDVGDAFVGRPAGPTGPGAIKDARAERVRAEGPGFTREPCAVEVGVPAVVERGVGWVPFFVEAELCDGDGLARAGEQVGAETFLVVRPRPVQGDWDQKVRAMKRRTADRDGDDERGAAVISGRTVGWILVGFWLNTKARDVVFSCFSFPSCTWERTAELRFDLRQQSPIRPAKRNFGTRVPKYNLGTGNKGIRRTNSMAPRLIHSLHYAQTLGCLSGGSVHTFHRAKLRGLVSQMRPRGQSAPLPVVPSTVQIRRVDRPGQTPSAIAPSPLRATRLPQGTGGVDAVGW